MAARKRKKSYSRDEYHMWTSLSPMDQFDLLNFIAQNGRNWKSKLIKLWNGKRTFECLRILSLKRIIGESNLYRMYIPETGGVQKDYFTIVGPASHEPHEQNYFSTITPEQFKKQRHKQ